jgi:hypothetical protein
VILIRCEHCEERSIECECGLDDFYDVLICDFCGHEDDTQSKFLGMDACDDCLETLKRFGVEAPTAEILDPV